MTSSIFDTSKWESRFLIGEELRVLAIDADERTEFRYTGVDGGVDSLFHAAGYVLYRSGNYRGDARTLRELAANTIPELWDGGAASMIELYLAQTGHKNVNSYIAAVKDGTQAGDLLCIIALEFHFDIRLSLWVDTRPAPILHPHFCSTEAHTLYLQYYAPTGFQPLYYPELPLLEAENYCLTCGIDVPHPLETICDNCVRRPRFCTSCRIAYLDSKTDSLCVHCARRLGKTLLLGSQDPHDFEGIIESCDSGKPQTTPSSKEEKAPKFVVYLSNAPFDDFRSGDGTYMNKIVCWIDARKKLTLAETEFAVSAFRLVDETIAADIPEEEKGVPLITVPYIEKWPKSQKETSQMTMVDWEKYYEPARKRIFGKLLEVRKQDTHEESIHIFHVQVRYPDSGALYNAQFLKALRDAGFRIVVTCHEMEFNFLTVKNMQKTVVQMNEFASVADRVIFLNEYDLLNGVSLIDYGSLSGCLAARQAKPKTVEELEKALKEKDPVNPKGVFETRILTPPEVKQSCFHIPGIATVSGAPFEIEDVLKRPENMVVFGLIKQADAMDASADVAQALMEHFPGRKVYVVGKVFKDFAHDAIARLISRMCRLSGAKAKELIKAIDKLGETTQTDKAFYEELKKLIEVVKKPVTEQWKKFIEAVALEHRPVSRNLAEKTDVVSKLQITNEALTEAFTGITNVEPEPVVDIMKIEGMGALDAFQQEAAKWWKKLSDAVRAFADIFFKLGKSPEGVPELAVAAIKELQAALGQYKKKFLSWLENYKVPPCLLPIEIVFNASDKELQDITSKCKYAFKTDLKSMADNASSIISLMANGCITFTESKFDTPDEFRSDKPGQGVLSPVIMPKNYFGTCTGDFIVKEIRARRDDRSLDIQVLKNMLTMLAKRYGLDSVAEKHMFVYRTLYKDM